MMIVFLLSLSSVSQAKVEDIGSLVHEASVSQNRLHRQLLRILKNEEYSIAAEGSIDTVEKAESSQPTGTEAGLEEPFQQKNGRNDFIRLVKK